MALTPEQIKALPAWMQQLQGSAAGTHFSDGSGGYYGTMGGGLTTNPMTGESSGDAQNSYYHIAGDGNSPGQAYEMWGNDGNKLGNWTTSVDKSGFGTFAKNLAMAVAAVYGAGALGAGAGAADGSSFMAGDLVDPSLGGAGGAIGGGEAGGGLGIGAGSGIGGSSSLVGSSAGMAAPAASTAAFNGAIGSGGGGLLSGILPAGMSQYLGPAAMALGALSGSQGTKTSETSTRKTDPRVDPYMFGDGSNPGLLGYTQQQLARDQSPQNQAQLDQMKQIGMGLLSPPVAGNGFNRFFPGR
jgi:hypothetical protein